MTDESMDAKLTALTNKIEKESRFTRSLVVVCTAAMLGVSLVPVKIMLSDLPNLVVIEFMKQLEVIHMDWKVLEKRGSGSTSAPATPAAGTPAAE